MEEVSEKIIISFDDFGISEDANEKMRELLESGKIHRVSIMMNGVLRPQDVQCLLQSNVLLDIHLDRKMGIDENRKLKDGALKRLLFFFYHYVFGSARPDNVEKTWKEQIEYFQSVFQRLPDGISSHEHVHFFPPYLRTMLQLAREYDINYIRFGMDSSSNYNAVSLILNVLRKINRRTFLLSGMKSSNYMVSWDWVDSQSFDEYTRSIAPNKTTEIIFHPERPEEFSLLQRILFR